MLKDEISQKEKMFNRAKWSLRKSGCFIRLISILTIAVAIITMLVLLRDPRDHHHRGTSMITKNEWLMKRTGKSMADKSHGRHLSKHDHHHGDWKFDDVEESDDKSTKDTKESKAYELYKEELKKRKNDKDRIKFCVGAILFSICAYLAGRAASWASWMKPNSWRIKMMLKKSICMIALAVLLICFMVIPVSFRIVDSLELNSKVHTNNFKKSFHKKDHKKKDWSKKDKKYTYTNKGLDFNQFFEEALESINKIQAETINGAFSATQD